MDLRDSVKHKVIDDLTQKSTKHIKTELVKMTSEASLLPTEHTSDCEQKQESNDF